MNACTTDTCLLTDAADPLSAKCTWLNTVTCNDMNACTIDTCDPTTGCHFEPVADNLCDDNNACTDDRCNPASTNMTNPCEHTAKVCNTTTSVCKNSTCDPTGAGCQILDVVCPTTDNCTISGCNETKNKGCYVKDAGTCGFPVGIVAGIAAGAVAGIVVAAVAGAALLGGGAAYAYTSGAGAGLGATVANNPLYSPLGMAGTNPLHKA